MSDLIIVGSPYWARYLKNIVSEAGITAEHIAHRQLLKIWSRRSSVLLAVGYGGQLTFKRAAIWLVIWIWSLISQRKVHLYWIGSDVDTVRKRGISAPLGFIWKCMGLKHLCGAPWFVPALQSVGIEAVSAVFPYNVQKASDFPQPPLGSRYRIVTYIRPSAWETMSGSTIVNLAEALPEIDFVVIGMEAREAPDGPKFPKNLRFLGWVAEPLEVLASANAFIRLIEHDAYSGMVRDAQAMGKVVLYTKPVYGVIDVSGLAQDELIELVAKIGAGDSVTVLNEALERSDSRYRLPSYSKQREEFINALSLTYNNAK